jgi:hypothetical protein
MKLKLFKLFSVLYLNKDLVLEFKFCHEADGINLILVCI